MISLTEDHLSCQMLKVIILISIHSPKPDFFFTRNKNLASCLLAFAIVALVACVVWLCGGTSTDSVVLLLDFCFL
jgi:hypothetical protein